MPSVAIEDYLKRILVEQERSPRAPVSTGRLAEGLAVTPGSATAMVKSLAESGLVAYRPYAGVTLTRKGRRVATAVLRRHRIVESFLVHVMGYDWSEVHGDAEILEHAVSDRLLERMDDMLGRPAFDPHGDPIPTRSGSVRSPPVADLIECPADRPVVVARVLDQRPEFLRRLERHGVLPDRTVRVVERDALAQTLTVADDRSERLRLGFAAAAKVLVRATG